MKVFYINCADYGSTGKIIKETAFYLKQRGDKAVLCVPFNRDNSNVFDKIYSVCLKYEQGIYKRISKFNGNIYGVAPLSTMKVIRALKKEKPDLVHIHCINGYMVNVYKLFGYLKENKIPTVVTNHCEMFYTGNCDHAYDCEKWRRGCGGCEHLNDYLCGVKKDNTQKYNKKMQEAFAEFENLAVVSVSDWVNARTGESPITGHTFHKTIENGIDTEIFNFKPEKSYFKKYGVGEGKKVILHVTSLFNINSIQKGSKYIIGLAQKFSENSDVLFAVAGPYVKPDNCPENIVFLGRITDQNELAKIYSSADLCVITSKRETYGMSVAESLCCGTPIVGFKAGGPESITMNEYSEFCEYGDINSLKSIADKWINYKNNSQTGSEISENAIQKYSNKKMADSYYELYIKLLNKFA